MRKSNSNCCYGSILDEIPYCNSIFAQNSIKLAMRKYEKPGIKSCSDADIGYAISERASVEPQIVSEPEGNMYEFSPYHNVKLDINPARTTTTLVKYENDQNDNDSSKIELTIRHENEIQKIETFEQSLLVRPKINEFEAKKNDNENNCLKQVEDSKIQIKLTTTYPNDATGSSFRDDNWIFYGKKPSNDKLNDSEQKFETTSSILLNNDFSSNENTKNMNHTSAIEIVPSTMVTNLDGNYYFAEDTTLRTLTNSSCHSDRSLVQLNLVCCEIEHGKEENEKGSSRISEEEEECENVSEENNKHQMSSSNPSHLKCNLNQESHALKSYSHLPSSFCSTNADTLEEKSFINSCEINLTTSKKEFSLNINGKSETSDTCLDEDGEKNNCDPLNHKKQEAELSNILESMINEIEENSKDESIDELVDQTLCDEPNNVSNKITDSNEEENKKNKTAILLAALNAKTIGTIIYENRVNDEKAIKCPKQISNEMIKNDKTELKVQISDHDKQLLSKSSKITNLIFS